MVGGWEEGARGLLPKGPSFQVSLFQGAVDPSPSLLYPQPPNPRDSGCQPRIGGPRTLLECEFLRALRWGQSSEEDVAGTGGSRGDGGRLPGPGPGPWGDWGTAAWGTVPARVLPGEGASV